MKIKNVILTLGVAAAMGFGVFAGLKAGKGEVKEAKAADTDYIYLDNSNFYQGNERYAAFFFTDGEGGGSEWVNFTWDASIGYNKVAIKSYEKVILCRMDGGNATNDWSARWAQTGNLANHTGIYKPYSKEGGATPVSGSWRYPLTVGSTTTYMIPNGTGEVKATVTATANDAVSLKEDEDSAAGVLYPQTKASNNMTSDKHIKISGSTTIYVAKSGWSTFASGYAPSSTKLQDFCDALIALDCSSKDLTSCGWSGLNETEKLAFNNGTVTLGNGVSYTTYGSVVNEAATRYVRLINGGATPLSGVTLTSSTNYLLPLTNEANNTAIIIVISSVVAITSLGLFFFIKRKKESK